MRVLAKIGLWGMFINYYPYHIMFGHMIPHATEVCFVLIILGIVGENFSYPKLHKTINLWIVYLLLCLVTSVFALNTSYAVNELIKFGIKLIVIIAIERICVREESVRFPIRLLAGIAILSAAAAFIQMGSLRRRLDLASGASISINDFGSLMAYGCFAVIIVFRELRSTGIKNVLIGLSTTLLIVEMFISGSRKSFYSIVILYVLLFFLAWRNKEGFNPKSLFQGLFIIAIVFTVYRLFLDEFVEETSMFMRLFGSKSDAAASSDAGRWRLYIIAWENFKISPLFGIGFNNMKVKYGMYSHSTYAEPLAVSGIIGLLYLVPIIKMLVNQIKMAFNPFQDTITKVWNKELLVFYVSFLFIGAGIPYLYKEIPCICFGIIMGWQSIWNNSELYYE